MAASSALQRSRRLQSDCAKADLGLQSTSDGEVLATLLAAWQGGGDGRALADMPGIGVFDLGDRQLRFRCI